MPVKRQQEAIGQWPQSTSALGVPHHLADADLLRRPREFQTAAAPANAVDEAGAAEIVDDLDQMVARHAVALRYFRHRAEPPVMRAEIGQHAQCVVGVERQPHPRPLILSLVLK